MEELLTVLGLVFGGLLLGRNRGFEVFIVLK